MKLNIFRRKVANMNYLFSGQYIDPKALFLATYDGLPNVTYMTSVDVNAALGWMRSTISGELRDLYQYAEFNAAAGTAEFNVQYYVLHKPCIVEIGTDFVTLYHDRSLHNWAAAFLRELAAFRKTDGSKTPIGFATRQAIEN